MSFKEYLYDGPINEGAKIVKSSVDSTKADWIYKFKQNNNYDEELIQKHSDYDNLISDNKFAHPPADKEYIKINVFGTDRKAVEKELMKQVKKQKGYELLHAYTVGKKGQDWTGLIWKHGFGGFAVLFK